MTSAEPLGWGILGCGRMARKRIAPAFREVSSARLVGCMARSFDRAKAFRDEFAINDAYDDIDRFLANNDIGAVYIGTPSANHYEHALRCIDAGKHVLVDKPLATNGADAQRIVDAAASRGATLGVLHQQRFHPAVQQLLELVTSGTLGRLLVVRLQIAMWLRLPDNWRFNSAQSGGGALMDLGPHAIDVLLKLLGRPCRVDAHTARLALDAEVEDFCSATIEFDSGGIGLIDLSYSGRGYGGRIEVFGEKGSFACDGCLQQAPTYTIQTRIGEISQNAVTLDYDGSCFRMAIEDFNRAIFDHSSPTISGEDGVAVQRTIDEIYEAIR